ncbi:multidrug effflux MFS transporter [Pedobacter sp. SYSU D00535]|uniref:multidrug effflux MFS transporter n=1 Tax=Pedobacter sp. SYSU D00535 TaxID=2810308 RepID=UPI001A973A1B|nr:multidrug effflux MFS transporter [Pedobacter sp. SYSU D00535]
MKNRFLLILILGALSAIGPFSIDMYLPGFPAIAEDLDTSVAQVSLSLTSFFIGISAGQLLYGPLLDRFGRKKPLYFGLAAYVLTSIGCALVESVEGLIALRFLQAAGGCAGMVASRAMVRDLFPVSESAKVFSTLMLVIGVSPIIAPTLGGYVTATFGWHSVFVILFIMGLAVLAGVFFVLPETQKPDTSLSLKPRPILRNFLAVLKEPQFLVYTLSGSVAAAGLYAYISGSPYVFMEIFQVTEQEYGWIFAAIAVGIIGSSQLNTVALKHLSSRTIILRALICQVSTGLLLVSGAMFGFTGLYSTIALIFLFLCCQGFTFPNTSALAMAPFSKNAGSASALMGSVQMAVGAFTSFCVSILTNHTAIPMTAVMATCSVSSLGILLIGRKFVHKQLH